MVKQGKGLSDDHLVDSLQVTLVEQLLVEQLLVGLHRADKITWSLVSLLEEANRRKADVS